MSSADLPIPGTLPTLPPPSVRPRQLRRTPALRRMVQETQLSVNDLIYPLFVMEGQGEKVEIDSMPGCYRYSLDLLTLVLKGTTLMDWYSKLYGRLSKQCQRLW